MTKTQIAIFKLRFCYLRAEMKMIRAGGVFNFREMIAHVNSNKKLQDFTIVSSSSDTCPHLIGSPSLIRLACLISPSADKVSMMLYYQGSEQVKRHLLR